LNMAYPVPTFEQIRDRYLQAVVNQQADAEVGEDSDHFVRACGTAAVAEGLYAHQSWIYRQIFADTADDDVMIKKATQSGVPQKQAGPASGTARFVGTVGADVPLNTAFRIKTQGYVTTAAAVVSGDGTVDVAAVAVTPGLAGNLVIATAATMDAPPSNIASVTVLTMSGGVAIESPADLLQRLLLRQGEPAQGGNAEDYVRWALDVPGVVDAYSFPLRRGGGTVDVVPITKTGLPSGGILAAVQAVLDARKPAEIPAGNVLALAYTEVLVAITGSLDLEAGVSLDDVLVLIATALDRIFAAIKPGQRLVRNQVIKAILSVDGVVDVNLTSPAANIDATVDATVIQRVVRGATALT
jgi:uncharacterized phage protein gp47/JayE